MKGWQRKGARKHAGIQHKCRLCGKVTHGNGGSSQHAKACHKKRGLEWVSDRDHRIALEYELRQLK